MMEELSPMPNVQHQYRCQYFSIHSKITFSAQEIGEVAWLCPAS